MQPQKKVILSQIKRATLLLSFWLLSFQLLAQENLTGRWNSYSEIFRNKELTTKDTRDQIVIILNEDLTYRKFFYVTDEQARLSYEVVEERFKFKDADEKVKRKKVTERGTYQITENAIEFVTEGRRYSQRYQLQEGVLVLTEFAQDDPDMYVIKFKRAR